VSNCEGDQLAVARKKDILKQKLVDEWHRKNSVFWNDIYKRTDLNAFLIQQRHLTALKYIHDLSFPEATNTLEIGCGAGLMAIALAKAGFTVTAIDSLREMIELSQRNARDAGVANQINSMISDVHGLAFQDQSFDLVVALGVTPWLFSLRKALAEIARVLVPGGCVVLQASNVYHLNRILDPVLTPAFEPIRKSVKKGLERAGLYNPSKKPQPRFFSPKNFNLYLREANLANVRDTTLGFGPFTLLGRSILPDRIEHMVHQKLQQCADNGFPILRMAGFEYIVLAKKISMLDQPIE
jgi:ubiquinone/menaquinone biosynthesis C-methylase UbiE